MKKVMLLIISILLISVFPVYASSFQSMYEIDTEIYDGDTVYVRLGIKEKNMQAVSGTISYDSEMIKLERAIGLNGYDVDYGQEASEKMYKTFKFVADSSEAKENVYFMELCFKMTKEFDVHDTADIFFYNYEIGTSDLKKYRSNGKLMTLAREEKDMMLFNLEEIDSSLQRRYWLKEHKVLIISIVVIIIGGIVSIFLIPSKVKKESREDKIRNQNKAENYDRSKISSFVSKVDRSNVEETIIESPFANSSSKYKSDTKKEEDPFENLKEDGIKEIEDENLIQISTVNFEEKDDIEKLPIIITLLLVASFAFIGIAKAEDYSDNLYNIRECIIGESKYNKEYDLDNNNKIDVLDLILERKKQVDEEKIENENQSDTIDDIKINIEENNSISLE